jgi:hypothetical protein
LSNPEDYYDYQLPPIPPAQPTSPSPKTKLCQVVTPNQNGCGAKNGMKFPQKLFFWNFEPACNAHDLCWGTCGANKSQCDKNFLNNMLDQCDHYWFIPGLANICRAQAFTYYAAVSVSQGVFDGAQSYNCKEVPINECCPTPIGEPESPPLPTHITW